MWFLLRKKNLQKVKRVLMPTTIGLFTYYMKKKKKKKSSSVTFVCWRSSKHLEQKRDPGSLVPPPLVVMVTSLFPTSHVSRGPSFIRKSTIGVLRFKKITQKNNFLLFSCSSIQVKSYTFVQMETNGKWI